MEYKVVHVSAFANGGAGIAAYRLHKAMLNAGGASSFICKDNSPFTGRDRVFITNKEQFSLPQRIVSRIKRNLLMPLRINGFNDSEYYGHRLNKIKSALHCEIATLPFSAFRVENHPLVQQADIVHLHWVSEFINYPTFFRKLNKPVVWTMHDMNPVKGLFHYHNDEVRNKAVSGNLNKEIESIKKKIINRFSKNLVAVTPSRWLQEEVENSDVLVGRKVATIPNTLNTSVFNLKSKAELRNEMGIPLEHTVFLFVSQTLDNDRKGFDLLNDALAGIDPIGKTMVIVGQKSVDFTNNNFNCVYTGFVEGDNHLSKFYSVADAFILPSREDNLPNVMLEAMACGTPVISFNVGGMKEIIQDGFNGLKAYETTAQALSKVIDAFINTKEQYNSINISEFSKNKFSEKIVTDQYFKIYDTVL